MDQVWPDGSQMGHTSFSQITSKRCTTPPGVLSVLNAHTAVVALKTDVLINNRLVREDW
jgi:hypothetical protein